MSWNGTGGYQYPTGQPVASGTLIASSTFNTYTADIGNMFANVVTRDGQGTFTGQAKFFDGTVTAPGISYNSESSTGFYRAAAGTLAISILGVQVANFQSTGLTVTGGITNTGNIVTAGYHNVGTAATLSAGDISVSRSASTGCLYLGSNLNHYLYFDGTNYNLPSGNLVASGGSLTSNFGTLTSPSSYGSVSVSSSTGGYAGIQFASTSGLRTLMVSNTASGISGIYDVSGSTWEWYFTGSTLTQGTVPAANISGTVASASNATTVGGFTPSATSGTASRVVVADSSGYINNTYFNSSDNSVASGLTAVMCKTGDNYIRSGTAAGVAAFISGQAMNISGSSTSCSGNSATVSMSSGRTDGTAYPVVWGTATATSQLYSCSAVTITSSTGTLTATAVSGTSDSRLKDNITTIDNALDKVSKLDGVTFNWKATGQKATGLVAQNVQEVMPEAVVDGEYLSVQYGNLVGLLVEAIKELKAEVDALKGK